MRHRRPVLGFVLGAIVVTAALGLYAVLVPGEFGELQGKVLATSATISGTSILLLALVPAWERKLVGPVPLAGAGFTITSCVLLVVLIWSQVESDAYGKTMGTTIIPAVWCVLVSLLALATLPPRHQWTFLSAAGLTLALTALGVGAIWVEPDEEIIGRGAGALAVLSAALVLTVLVLHRASRVELEAAERTSAGGFCPRCGARVIAIATDEPAVCDRCGACFLVSYVETTEPSLSSLER